MLALLAVRLEPGEGWTVDAPKLNERARPCRGGHRSRPSRGWRSPSRPWRSPPRCRRPGDARPEGFLRAGFWERERGARRRKCAKLITGKQLDTPWKQVFWTPGPGFHGPRCLGLLVWGLGILGPQRPWSGISAPEHRMLGLQGRSRSEISAPEMIPERNISAPE